MTSVKDMHLREINMLTDAIKKADIEPVTRVTYDKFRRDFLPLLAERGEAFNIGRWIELVSHPHVALEVLNSDGSVKYRIPPLLSEQKTPDHVPEVNLSAYAKDFGSAVSDNPFAAAQMLYNKLMSYGDDEFDGEAEAIEMAQALNKVFADHDMELIELPDDVPQVAEDKVENKGLEESEILGYEEL